ncbi:response regulator [Cyanobacteria bacterium FACHB-DQ100]|nr:response regulator [Cyanobacteria bacterium FACHB-DQ100]
MELRSATVKVILLVEPDDAVRPALRDNLHQWGYLVTVTLDGADALQRTRYSGESFDLILINQFKQSIDETVDLGRQIRQHADHFRRIPIVVMAEKYGPELEGKDIQVGESEYVTYLEDGQQLKHLLHTLCPL